MSRTPSNFRQSDVTRALRAIEGAGQKAESVVIEDRRIEIKLKNGKCAADNNDHDNTNNPWDAVDQ